MKQKIRNLLTASFVTLGLLTLLTSSSVANIKPGASIKQSQSLMNDTANIAPVNHTLTKTVVSYKDKLITVSVRNNQFNRPNLVEEPAQNFSLLTKIFAAFVLVGLISGCVGSISGFVFQYRQYKKLTEQKPQVLPEAKDFASFGKINVSLREKQIETLERIWKMDIK